MADELNKQKTFLTWEDSAAVLQTDARQGIAIASHCYGLTAPQGDSNTKKNLQRLVQPNTLF